MKLYKEYICYEKLVYQSEIERMLDEGFRIVSQDKKVTLMEKRDKQIIIRYRAA